MKWIAITPMAANDSSTVASRKRWRQEALPCWETPLAVPRTPPVAVGDVAWSSAGSIGSSFFNGISGDHDERFMDHGRTREQEKILSSTQTIANSARPTRHIELLGSTSNQHNPRESEPLPTFFRSLGSIRRSGHSQFDSARRKPAETRNVPQSIFRHC